MSELEANSVIPSITPRMPMNFSPYTQCIFVVAIFSEFLVVQNKADLNEGIATFVTVNIL